MGRKLQIGNQNTMENFPHPLLDALRKEVPFSSDGEMSKALGVQRSALSKIRHGNNDVSSEFILRVYKIVGWSIEKIESHLGREVIK